MGTYRRTAWHKSWHHRSAMYCAASWTFWAKLMLIHVSYISIGAVHNGDWAVMSSNEWRPPEPNPWSPVAGSTDSPVTMLTSSLAHAAQQRPQHNREVSSSVTSFDRSRETVPTQPTTLEKHFLFRRDLSKAPSTSVRHTLPPVRAWADNGAGTICHDPGSMDGNCTTNRERSPTLMTSASNTTALEDLLLPLPPNVTGNEYAYETARDLELATLESPLDGNHTAHGYPAVNLNDHNDALCDDSDQMEYNENCFIDHNVTCVGDPDFCNLTYGEYRQLLMDYIYPSTGEWILIASHTVVFLMGLFGIVFLHTETRARRMNRRLPNRIEPPEPPLHITDDRFFGAGNSIP
uniref:Uncharacterized protein n=1 Tax=Anopheles culicifacies TaxID=139723 RepID=A0A182M7M6_9DIPT